MSELPRGWLDTTLGQVVDYAVTEKAEPEEIAPDAWILELEDIERDTSKLVSRYTFAQRQSKSTKNRFLEGDVLYGKLRPYLNKVVVADADGYCTTEVIPIRPNECINGRFLFYALKREEFLDYVQEIAHGLNMPRLGTEQGRNGPIRLAPLNEQKRIADKLDRLLARVDAAKARLDKTSALLKRLRQSILASAASGKLTDQWRETHAYLCAPTDEQIVDAWSNEFAKRGRTYRPPSIDVPTSFDEAIPSTWRMVKLGNAFDVYVGATPSRKEPTFWNGDVPWVSSGEVAFCRIKGTRECITDVGLANTSTELHPVGTIMLAMIGQGKTRGQPAILDVMAAHNQNTAALRVHPDIAVSEYLHFFLWGQYEKTREIGSGNNQQAMNKATVQAMDFPLPPVAEQKEIVRRVEELFAIADRIEAQYQAARARVDRLTQSLLAKAFRGELVPQDPNDEPASVLLDRIRAQRAAAPAERRGGRGRPVAAELPMVAEPKGRYARGPAKKKRAG